MGNTQILVVEDEGIVAKDLQWRLENMNYEVPFVIATGEEAVEKSSQTPPDLILMDIMLAGRMDGISAANIIREQLDVPIIYLTAYADNEILERAKVTEPYGYLIKPVDDRDLQTNIELSLHKHRIGKKLRENQKWLSTVLNSIGDAVITTDTKGRIQYLNPAAEKLIGWASSEIAGKQIKEALHIINEQTHKDIPHPVQEALKNGEIVTLAKGSSLITRSGAIVPIDDSCAPIRDENGNIIGVVLVIADITEKRTAEEDLQKSEEQVRLLLNSTAEAIYGLDLNGKCTFCNPSCLQLLGYEKEEELLEKNMHSLIHHTRVDGTPYPLNECRIRQVIKTGQGLRIDNEILWKKDGTFIYADYHCHPVLSDGEVIGAVVTFLDISESRKAEELITNILENVGEGFAVIDNNYRIISANKSFAQQAGLPAQDIVGQPCYKISHHNDRPCYETGEKCPVKKTFESGLPQKSLHTHYNQDGTLRHIEIKTYAMKDETKHVHSVIQITNDLTEQRKLENQLRHAQKMEAVGHLAGGVAHDFNNILTAISGYGEILKYKMDTDDPLVDDVQQILFAAERAVKLTKSLLAFSRKQMIHPKPTNFNRIVEDISQMMQRIIGEDIYLAVNKLTNRKPNIMADSSQIEHVLVNLATNARDAMPMGGLLAISTEIVEFDDDFIKEHGFGRLGYYVMASVKDTGEGMDIKTRDQIFEPFFTTKEVGKGTGLGLAMVYGIIKQHKGFINVLSEQGQGTDFRFYLPLIKSEEKYVKPDQSFSTQGGNETILLAEDDEATRKLIKRVLVESGYTVIEAKNGLDAIQKFDEHHEQVQLFISDIIMPQMNGNEAFKEIRKFSPNIKAIFISGYTDEMMKHKGIFDDDLNFVSKPFSPQKVLEKIREVLDSDLNKV